MAWPPAGISCVHQQRVVSLCGEKAAAEILPACCLVACVRSPAWLCRAAPYTTVSLTCVKLSVGWKKMSDNEAEVDVSFLPSGECLWFVNTALCRLGLITSSLNGGALIAACTAFWTIWGIIACVGRCIMNSRQVRRVACACLPACECKACVVNTAVTRGSCAGSVFKSWAQGTQGHPLPEVPAQLT